LLFAGLIAALLVAQGTDNSFKSFEQEGFNNRFLVSATPDPPLNGDALYNKDTQNLAKQIYTQTISSKKVAAKKLAIDYDPNSEPQPLTSLVGASGQQSGTILNVSSPAAQEALHEYIQAHPSPGVTRLREIARPYHPVGFYTVVMGGVSNGSLQVMQNGDENFAGVGVQQHDILQNTIEAAPQQMTRPFLLPQQAKQYDPDAIPVILPYSDAEKLLGMKTLQSNAPPSQELAQIKELYTKASGITFTACYRNSISGQQISMAIDQAAEMAKNKDNKQYQKPDLIYGLPAAGSCGPATVLSDARTSAEKALQAKQDTFNREFGDIVDPIQEKLSFRVVGLTPDQSSGPATTLSGILQSVAGSSLDNSVIIPSNMLDKMPNATAIRSILFSGSADSNLGISEMYYAEFANANDARNFIADKTCTTRVTGSCATAQKPFQLDAYGSSSIALADLRHKFTTIFKLAMLTVAVLAILIMSVTIGRIIADSRRETAVFRAIGAKRLDIGSIFSIYTSILTVCVALFALGLGFLTAHFFDIHYWQEATLQAQLIFGASDTAREFHFFALNIRLIGLIVLLMVVCGVVGMLIPLARNIRRNPIKDLRDET